MSFFGKNLEKLIEVAKITRKIRYENVKNLQK